MKKVLAILAMASVATFAMAAGGVTAGTVAMTGGSGNAVTPAIDVLGAHNNYGRGCAGCHAPHSGANGNGGNAISGGAGAGAFSGVNALFGQDYGSLNGIVINTGDISPTNTTGNSYTLTVASSGSPAAMTNQQYSDLRGIVMCLACHDGNVAKGAMMQNQAYEQQINALPTSYGSGKIPTLLGNNGAGAGVYNNDHPIGETALVNKAIGTAYSGFSGTPGLTWNIVNNAISSITYSGAYAQFVASYGVPAIGKGAYSYGTPLDSSNRPYVVCTTCHNQHVMNVYAASANNPIAGSATGTYATFFFINGPYNVNDVTPHPTTANSTTQFCRQCHFGESNEANGGTLTTSF
jgi:hypothetical protein